MGTCTRSCTTLHVLYVHVVILFPEVCVHVLYVEVDLITKKISGSTLYTKVINTVCTTSVQRTVRM